MITTVLFAIFTSAVYWFFTRTFDYWKKRGVKHDQPIWLFGNNLRGYLQKKSISQMGVELYQKYPEERVVGFFRSTRPELVVRDPKLIKRILLTHFNHFYYRGLIPNKEVVEPMMRNLFHIDGDLWRLLRQRMTGAFTSCKLKAMFPLVVERAEKLQSRVEAAACANRPLDAKDLMARYTTDFIGACGFGLDADSLNNEDSQFIKLGTKIFEITLWDSIKMILKDFFPRLLKHVRTLSKVELDVNTLVKNILRQRNYQQSGRNDFIDLLLECQKKGAMVADSLLKVKPDGTPELAIQELTQDLLVAQVFLFFAAGFETSSTATSFTMHQLAFHPEVQLKVQADIDRALRKHGGKLSYDAVKDMTYLHWTFKEGMRMFPSLGFLYRECSLKYTFKDLNFSIDEGVRVLIPVQALHNDPAYFPNPEQFRPERFDPNEYNADNKFVYLPFGEGPRSCIAAPLGQMQSLAGMAAVLSRFTVEPGPTTVRHPVADPRSYVVQSVLGGLPLIFRARELQTTIP